MKLHQRRAKYHLCLRVPSDLVSVIGRKEIHQSLRTSNHRTASSRASQIKAAMLNGFESLRLARLSVRNNGAPKVQSFRHVLNRFDCQYRFNGIVALVYAHRINAGRGAVAEFSF